MISPQLYLPSFTIAQYTFPFACNSQTYLDIAPAFLRLSSASDQELTELTLSESLQSPIFVTIHLAIRDSLGKTHHYSPSFIDLVSSIVTDIQNCPFIRLPMKITKNGEDCDDNLPIWNLLSDAEDSSVFRATEVLLK